MSLWPRSLWARLVLALLAAAGGVALLHSVVVARERQQEQARRSVRRPVAPAVVQSPLRSLGFPLLPVAGVVLLASRVEAIPPDVAPVLQVFLDGSIALRRPAPPVSGPAASASVVNRDGIGAAVVVPRGNVAGWTPAARVAVAELLGTWIGERPLALARVRDVDLGWRTNDLARFLAWVP